MLLKMNMYPQNSMAYLSVFLNVFGIKERNHKTCLIRKDLCFCMISMLHPFPIFLYFSTLYNVFALYYESESLTNNSKAWYSSYSKSILSLMIWHLAHLRSNALHNAVRVYSTNVGPGKNLRTKYIILTFLFGCFLLLLLFATYVATFVHRGMVDYVKFWTLSLTDEVLTPWKRVLIFFGVFTFIGQQMIFPIVLLVFFCMLTLKLGENLEQIKNGLKTSETWKKSVLELSRIHKEYLLQISRHEELLSLPIFILLILLIMIGFSGMALEMQQQSIHSVTFNASEGIFYMYFCLVGIISVTYSASRIPILLKEIREIYKNAYETSIVEIGDRFSVEDMKGLMILKTMYEREVIHLTAWGVIHLEKNFTFTVLGGLLTYGFLIIQVKNDI